MSEHDVHTVNGLNEEQVKYLLQPIAKSRVSTRSQSGRALSYVEACVEWQGARNPHGYGHSSKGDAHRVAWIEANGPIPEGMVVMHLCDNPPCVNLRHLRLGTQSENVKDAYDKGRRIHHKSLVTHCPQGHAYEGDNLYIHAKTGSRKCRACRAGQKRSN